MLARTLTTLALVALAAPLAAQNVRPPNPGEFTPLRYGDAPEHAYDEPFFPGAAHDPAIPAPSELLGFRHGDRLTHHAEILRCFRAWAEASPRMTLATHALSHEGRELVHAVVTSPENHARLDAIRANLARLADPRGLSDAGADAILADTPPVAWLGYSIHGDELSGADAALAFAHHLAASTDAETVDLLRDVVVVIEPVMNPDGRERIIGMVEQSAGAIASLDYASMHRGRWPWGRGNHYLFDLNRDWMAGLHPETRGRWEAALSFHPQLFVDAHEMGSLDTYLFSPPREPINPHLPSIVAKWEQVFARDQAAAFDRHGWSYYTREWFEAWPPFYSDAWGSLIGAVGILYEQANTQGSALRRASGEVLTYRESVHHQAVSSLANARTLQRNARTILSDYLADARAAVDPAAEGNGRSFVLVPGANVERDRTLLSALLAQDVEVWRSTEPIVGRDAEHVRGAAEESVELPAGSFFVPAAQPQGRLVKAYLELDPHLTTEALLDEREELERKGESRIYDVSAWNYAQLLDVDGWWCETQEDLDARAEPLAAMPPDPRLAGVAPVEPEDGHVYGWLVDGADDASVAFAARAMEHGLEVHVADEGFTSAGRAFARGSLLVRAHENLGDAAERVARAASESGVTAVPTATGRSPDAGPDLGGGHFALLVRPRVAILSNAPVRPDTFGHVWHVADRGLGLPIAMVDAAFLADADLRRYNVLVLPAAWDDLEPLIEPHVDALATWVEGGGTLVACGNAAAPLTRERLGLSEVVLRRDALDELERFRFAAEREADGRAIEVDEDALWNGTGGGEELEGDEGEETEVDDALLEERDEWMRRFEPLGAILRGHVSAEDWITFGCGDELPVWVEGDEVYLAGDPVRTPVRLAAADRLRIAGLLWPEARERMAESAWLTVERRGDGQVILFAFQPAFRGFYRSAARLLANAIVYGPGAGATAPIGW